MRVTTAFSRLLRLPGVWVRKVRFERGVVVAGCTTVSGASVRARICRITAATLSPIPPSQGGRRAKRPSNDSRSPCSLGTSRASVACRTTAALKSPEARAAKNSPVSM